MEFTVMQECSGRFRVHLNQNTRLSDAQSEEIRKMIENIKGVTKVTVYNRSADVAVSFQSDEVRKKVENALKRYKGPVDEYDKPDPVKNGFGAPKAVTTGENLEGGLAGTAASVLLPGKIGIAYNAARAAGKGLRKIREQQQESPEEEPTESGENGKN